MNTERSPRFPGTPLSVAVAHVEKLYAEAGRAAITAATAAEAIGYSGISGSSRTALAALSGYGLIQREGDTHRITDDALSIIRPLSAQNKLDALRQAALRPKVFAEIHETNPDCSESVLSSILLRKGFTEDGASRAASIYKENNAFLSEQGYTGAPSAESDSRNELSSQKLAVLPNSGATLTPAPEGRPAGATLPFTGNMLAQYQIPLGANQAHLAFTGEELVPEDFDELIDYVKLFKKQFERKLGVKATRETQREMPLDGDA